MLALTVMAATAPLWAQRVSASGVRADEGFVWQNGVGPTQWLRLRATNLSLPPRTVRYGWASTIQIVEAGLFGRVALLWSGWEGNGGDRAEYWLKCAYKSPPIYEAAHLYDTLTVCSDRAFRARLWNEQYFSWQPRSVEVSLFVANAPLPSPVSFQQPSWTNLSDLDRVPLRPGIQLDPLLDTEATLDYFTGAATLRRPLIEGLQRATGANAYVSEARPSPFRDRATLDALATLKFNNDAPQTLWSRVYAAEWAPLDAALDRRLGDERLRYTLDLANYPTGATLTLTYQVSVNRLPFDKFGQPMTPPAREPIDDLRDGQNLNFDLRGLTYSYGGAVGGGGSVSDEEAQPVCLPKEAGSLNLTLNLREFIPDLPIDLVVTLTGARIDADAVRWSFDIYPNRCVNIDGVNALVKRIWGQLTATLEVVPVFLDDGCRRYYTLRLTPEGGDSGNWMNAELYALCFENPATRVNVAVRNIDYVAYGGGVFLQDDPRRVYYGVESQLIELIRYGDVNGDGCVNDIDLLEILFHFGASGNHSADLNGDGMVSDADLLMTLLAFGNGC